jgi:putative ABC transport system permease protein
METAGNVIGTIQAVIFAIAAFSILIGAIGIMNTMYTSVRERTKEIGIMKAVGAKTTAITQIFLIEAGIMGLIGGVGGMVLGITLAKLAAFAIRAQASMAIQAYISPGMVIFTIIFAIAVGCVSGYLPARKAAKLNPVDALRYE